MEGVERWRSTTSAVLLILMAVGVFPGIANGLLKEGLYVSNKTDILFIFNPEFSTTERTVSVYKQAGRLTGLTYDKCNEQLYWSNVDVVNRGIYRGSLDADGNVNNVTKIIGTDVLEVSGLTFDWVSKHLYWTDSRKKTVEVADADGGNRRVLVMTGKGAPRGIYADPINGYLFWTDQGQKHIARSRLDGSEQTVIVTQGVDLPNQIVVYKDKLYWVDSSKKTFESSDLSGGQRKTSTITPANGQHIFGLAIHDDRAHITNWMNGQLIGIDTNGSNIARGIQNLGKDELFSAIYVSSMYQPKRNDLCANKRCSGLCLPVKANEARCTCPSYGGKILGIDGMSCIAPTNPILLVAMADSGYVGFFDASDHSKTDIYVVGRSLRPVAVAYDPVTKNVFWSDVRERTIHLANIDGTNHRILLRNSHGIGLVEGMLVDVARRQFYYTNIGSVLINGTAYSWHRIETFSLRSLTDVKVKTIVMTADKPRGLALDSTRNHLYYTDWGNRASIVRVNLDGSDPTLIRTGLENPNGIVFLNEKIYFVDSHFKSRQGTDGGGTQQSKNGSLYSMDPNGSNLRDILATTGVKLRTPFGLTATTSGLYVGDWETENLILVHLNGTLSRTILQGTSGLMSLSYTQSTATAPGRTSCDSKTCGDICLPKTASEASCTCNSYGGKSLSNSGTSCSVPSNFLIVADMNSIKIVSQDGKDSNPYVAVQGVPFTSNYVALAFDNGRRIVYYSDISRKEISALHLSNMTSMSLYRINEVIDGMVYHSGSLYWTDYTNGRISRLNLSPTSGQGLRHEILVRDLSRPRAIRIHENYIYWTEWGRVPKISRRPLNENSSPVQMYTSLKLVWPNGISIFNQKLYLVDGSTKKIYRCPLDPSDRCETVNNTEKVLKHAYDLWATDGGVFYYSDWETGSIKAFDSSRPGKTWTIVDGLMRPTQFQFSPLSSRPNCPSGTCSGGSCVPLWVNPGCDCGNRIPTYDLKNCTSESATSCSYDGYSSAPEQSFKPSPCLNCRCVGRRSWANDPVYNDSVCERISCPKLECGGVESHTPEGQCCPICRSCGIRITNCPKGSVNLTLSSNQGYVVYDFLPTIKDCLGLAREVSTTRQPTGAIYRRGKTEVHVISRADAADPDDCKFDVIVRDITAPTINCPDNITTFLTWDKASTEVNWRPPQATDNDELHGPPVASMSRGTSFAQGVHNINYTARDRSGHTASCWFTVNVIKLDKPAQGGACKIPQIDNAVLTCSAGNSLACAVQACQPNFEMIPHSWSSICNNGVWTTNVTDNILHKTCIKTTKASVIGSLEVTLPESAGACSKDLKYTTDFLKDSIYKGYVRPSAWMPTLDVTVSGCDATQKQRVIDVIVVGQALGSDRQNLTTEINEVLKRIRDDLEGEFIRVVINDNSGLSTVHDLTIKTNAAATGCPSGQIPKQGDECEVCDVGTYHEKSNQTCVKCPPNTYNHLTGQTVCFKCPEGSKSGTGSSFADQCIEVSVKSEFPIMIVAAAGCFLLLLIIIIIAIVCVKRRSDSKGFNDHPNLNVNKVYDPDLDFDCTYDKIADPEPAPNNRNNYESLESAAATAATANTYDTILACTEEGDGKGAEGCDKGSTSEKGDGNSTPPYLEPGKSTPPYLEPGKSTPPYLEPGKSTPPYLEPVNV